MPNGLSAFFLDTNVLVYAYDPADAAKRTRALEVLTRLGAQQQLSYWDSLIWATAKLSGVPTVLSEDFSDGRLIEGVRFLNPFMSTFDLTRLGSPLPSA
jgi:predicted nucleic acid-binding protein